MNSRFPFNDGWVVSESDLEAVQKRQVPLSLMSEIRRQYLGCQVCNRYVIQAMNVNKSKYPTKLDKTEGLHMLKLLNG